MSPYLDRPRRSEEEAREQMRCRECRGTGEVLDTRVWRLIPCPVCNPEPREEGNG